MYGISSRCVGRWFAALAAALSLLALAVPAGAATFEWTDQSIFYDSPNAWSLVSGTGTPPPDAGDSVQFNLPGDQLVIFSQNEASDNLLVTDGDVTFASNNTATLRTYTIATGSADANISGGSLQIGTPNQPVFLNLPNTLSGGGLSASIMDIGGGASGSVTVESTSRLDVLGSGNHSLGFSGATGELTINGGTANIGTQGGTLRLGISGAASSHGDVQVAAGGTLNTGHIQIATTTSGASGAIEVTGGGSTINQVHSGANLTIGSASGGGGTLDVISSGSFNTGTGTTTVNATGSINIAGGGFSANGDVELIGGSITRTSGNFSLGIGRTLTATSGAQIDFGGSTALSGGTTWLISDGADLFNGGFMDIGIGGGVTDVTIDGLGSSLATDSVSFWGLSGHTADVTVRNGASANVGQINLARSSMAGTTGTIAVESGATMNTGPLVVATFGGTTTTGTITVTGDGSELSQSGSSALTLGDATSGTATLNVLDGGTFNTGTGTTTVNATGSINIDGFGGGAFNANGDVNVNGGSITRSFAAFNLAAGRTLTATAGAQLDFGGDMTLSGGTTWDISDGADLYSGPMNIGTSGGVTALTIDGEGSSLNVGNANWLSLWGIGGHTAEVTVRNDATAQVLGQINLAESSTAGTTGTIAVESGATMTVGGLFVAAAGGASTTGTITVAGDGSSLTQVGSRSLTLGHSSTGTAQLDVLSGGTFNTGTGSTYIGATGTLNIGGGTFNANGNVTVNGGSITRIGGDFNLASGRTLTATNGAQIDVGVNNFGFGAQLSGGTTWFVESGADLFTSGFMDIGVSGGVTEVTIDGPGSTIAISSSSNSHWGGFGNAAHVTVRNDAQAEIGGIFLADSLGAMGVGNTSTIAIESGATMTTRSLGVASLGGTANSGTITVTGAGSELSQVGTSTLTLGHATSGTATLNVLDGGTFGTGTGAVFLNATGTINIDGGTFDLNGPITGEGTFNFTSGQLNVNDPTQTVVVSPSGQQVGGFALDSSPTLVLGPDRGLSVAGTTRLDSGASLELAGESFEGGTLLIQPGASLVNTAPATATAAVLALAGSTIDAAGGDLALGNAALVNGFGSAATLRTHQHTVTLLDANDAVFDSLALVTLGNAASDGTLAAPNGLTLDFGGNITGRGTVDTPDDPFRPLTNNGHITGNSPAEPITLTGYVKGVGTLDHVVITGTDAPGFSPAAVYRGSVEYAGALEIELAGATSGQFDAIHHSGIATLGGTLDVSLLGAFAPEAGSSFEIITALGGVTGMFADELLPTLASGLDWNVVYGSHSVLLEVAALALPGDFNADGAVDAADYVLWRKTLGTPATYLEWRSNFGQSTGTGAGSNLVARVPEPAAAGLALVGLLTLVFRRGDKRMPY